MAWLMSFVPMGAAILLGLIAWKTLGMLRECATGTESSRRRSWIAAVPVVGVLLVFVAALDAESPVSLIPGAVLITLAFCYALRVRRTNKKQTTG